MTFSAAFAIVQWGIVLPVQVYFVWRSWRNWKLSDRDMQEAHDNLVRAKMALAAAQELRVTLNLDPDDLPRPPTVQ